MTARQLIKELQKHENIDLDIVISVDIGNEERIFIDSFLESLNYSSDIEIVLLFEK